MILLLGRKDTLLPCCLPLSGTPAAWDEISLKLLPEWQLFRWDRLSACQTQLWCKGFLSVALKCDDDDNINTVWYYYRMRRNSLEAWFKGIFQWQVKVTLNERGCMHLQNFDPTSFSKLHILPFEETCSGRERYPLYLKVTKCYVTMEIDCK